MAIVQDQAPAPSKDERKEAIALHYDKTCKSWRDIYDRNSDSVNTSFELINRRRIILRLIDQYAGDRSLKVADIGCGAGVLMRDVLERGHSTAGIDISKKMVEAARQSTCERYPGLSDCLLGEVDALPFDRKSFDCVICAGVLSHQPSDGPSVAELSRVVKNRGILLMSLPNFLKLRNVLDLHDYIALFSRVVGKRLSSGKKTQPGAKEFVRGGSVKLRKYYYGQLNTVFKDNGLIVRETACCAFGPLTFWKKEILPAAWSLKLSRFLENLAARKLFGFLRVFANSWVICLEKTE